MSKTIVFGKSGIRLTQLTKTLTSSFVKILCQNSFFSKSRQQVFGTMLIDSAVNTQKERTADFSGYSPRGAPDWMQDSTNPHTIAQKSFLEF